ncbi:uncharacterized protein LOC143631183 [Bidens hawaiensis]|uniref:uncharacterized protein LOC143631183 n=1 Tax=Bidens hawaiensis TaxID=980011 RepID=UPI00404B4F34
MDRSSEQTAASRTGSKLDLAQSIQKISNAEIPFSLTDGLEAMITAEIGVPFTKTLLAKDDDKELCLNLDLLKERCELAQIKESNYKCQLQKYYGMRVKVCNFNVGDYVYRNNEASNTETSGKLSQTWEGPYKVKRVLGKWSFELEKLDGKLVPGTWNVAQLEKCYV